MGTLSIFLRRNGQLGSPEWSRTKNQGNKWIRGELRIRNMREPYQIVFEGTYAALYSVSSIIKK